MMEVVEILVAVAIGVLAAVFLGSLAALALVCYRRALHAKHHLFYSQDIRPEVLMNSGELWSELELDDVRLAPQIDKILNDTQWVDDATGLIPHCLAILKLCHQMTERLVATTMTPIQKERLHDIIEVTRRLSPRIDDVARAMYPPLDPRLLEARCSALILTLTLLAWHARYSTSNSTVTLINEALKDMDRHLTVLREAAMAHETFRGIFAEDVSCDAAE
ncbi:transmembrane protein 98-like [Homarus americanus]|uniref:Transmembrane protein 98 n=1 Tax=Homarus americanus TaxID=6706 RepID=A0A8J5JVW3_HOMAM|nr:transmembrane protein 98-like [Homarus americanus]XP_042229191.1 transmembrane protein 98-like [Homarus americanus]XP_042229192.1 transmembrane protein 98-like [Homarus americanus]KAG7165150.1 Transmembrane protein 98-like [Homarus americanus]